MIYYISDLHFCHENIIKLGERPFQDIDLMNQVLIDNWNTKVTNEDTIYFLGDFAYKCNQNKATEILKQLNGKKIFIKGNHDKRTWLEKIKQEGLIEDYFDYLEIEDEGRSVILCHYPLHSWNRLYRGSYHLYGHVHQNTVKNEDWQKNRFNISCEVINYTPTTLSYLIEEREAIHFFVKNTVNELLDTLQMPGDFISGLTTEETIENFRNKIWSDFWKNITYKIDPDIVNFLKDEGEHNENKN